MNQGSLLRRVNTAKKRPNTRLAAYATWQPMLFSPLPSPSAHLLFHFPQIPIATHLLFICTTLTARIYIYVSIYLYLTICICVCLGLLGLHFGFALQVRKICLLGKINKNHQRISVRSSKVPAPSRLPPPLPFLGYNNQMLISALEIQ